MLHFNPNKRISINEALNHDFLKELHDIDYEIENENKFDYKKYDKLLNNENVDFKNLIYKEVF
jgi:hypothetical protein